MFTRNSETINIQGGPSLAHTRWVDGSIYNKQIDRQLGFFPKALTTTAATTNI